MRCAGILGFESPAQKTLVEHVKFQSDKLESVNKSVFSPLKAGVYSYSSYLAIMLSPKRKSNKLICNAGYLQHKRKRLMRLSRPVVAPKPKLLDISLLKPGSK